jgi:hypothetical protein
MIPNHVEVFSIHILKAAGTSFYHTLNDVYGSEQVWRLDMPLQDDIIKKDGQPTILHEIPTTVKIVHGHFSYHKLNQNLYISPQAQFITWLRHPIERILSHYDYLVSQLQTWLPKENHTILYTMQKSLLEFAARPGNKNKMSQFLQGLPLEQFAFVGIVEHYADDLQQLAQKLHWQHTPYKYTNKTEQKTQQHQIPTHVLEQLAEWNQADIDLYQQAIELRKKRTA